VERSDWATDTPYYSVNSEWVCQNREKDEKTQPVVPSSWEEGCGVVEKNTVITYYKSKVL
jgi:hypothetical protein